MSEYKRLNEYKRPAETPQERDARLAMKPHFQDLMDQYKDIHRAYRRPVAVEVPRHFPNKCDGGRLFGLPVRYADVDEPRVV